MTPADEQLTTFIEKARQKGLTDQDITQRLTASGWDAERIRVALSDDLIVPAPPSPSQSAPAPYQSHPAKPLAVAENLSPRGFEVKIFSVAVLMSIWAVLMLVNALVYGSSSSAATMPTTVLIVAAPIALVFFYRLAGYEREHPEFLHDASRRKSIQTIQLMTFLAVIGHTIFLVYKFVSGAYGESSANTYSPYYEAPSPIKDILSWLTTALVAGTVFLYYWRQEHRADQ